MSHPLGTDEEIEALSERLVHFFLSKDARSVDDALDLAQETLVRVLQYISNGEKIKSIEGYAIGVAKNIAFEYYRKIRKANKHDSLEVVSDMLIHNYRQNPELETISRDKIKHFEGCLADLPDKMRELLEDKFIKGMPAHSIAKKLKIPSAVVDMRVHRAKHKLRKMML